MTSGAEFVSRGFQPLGFGIAVISLVLVSGCQRGASVFTELDDARRLAADLRVEFNEAADASNRAVMADTDEASIRFAGDAEQTTKAVERDLTALSRLLRDLGYPNELRFVEQFRDQFSRYREIDRTILALAVENTNLKAQGLSFGPARSAADRFRDSLGTVISGVQARDRCRVEGLVAKAVLAVRDMQVLQAPHIAERDDAPMTRMEKEMAALETTAREALRELSGLVEPDASSPLAAANAALDQFAGISSEIVKLSRRNSNVRSLGLSLREKPPLTAACDDSLHALQDALAHEGAKNTR